MLEAAGFKVHDLGVDVSPEAFVEAVKEHSPNIIGLSALLTTTMVAMKDVIDALQEARIRKGVKVLVGGAPLTDEFAQKIGADAYARDAGAASDVALRLICSEGLGASYAIYDAPAASANGVESRRTRPRTN